MTVAATGYGRCKALVQNVIDLKRVNFKLSFASSIDTSYGAKLYAIHVILRKQVGF